MSNDAHDYPAICRSLAAWLGGESQGAHHTLNRGETADRLLEIAATLENQHYADIEHEHLGCHVAKTGIYAPSSNEPTQDTLTPISRDILRSAAAQFAQCIGVLDGHDNTRPEVMAEESMPYLQSLLALLNVHDSAQSATDDTRRLDYLAREAEEEQKDITAFGHVKMHSVFRRSKTVTREEIDDAMRFRDSINLERKRAPSDSRRNDG